MRKNSSMISSLPAASFRVPAARERHLYAPERPASIGGFRNCPPFRRGFFSWALARGFFRLGFRRRRAGVPLLAIPDLLEVRLELFALGLAERFGVSCGRHLMDGQKLPLHCRTFRRSLRQPKRRRKVVPHGGTRTETAERHDRQRECLNATTHAKAAFRSRRGPSGETDFQAGTTYIDG